MEFKKNESIKSVLSNYSSSISSSAVEDLLASWKLVANRAKDESEVDEYLNDLTVRKVLGELCPVVERAESEAFERELASIDSLFKENTLPIPRTLWSEEANKKYSQEKEKYWYYFRAPESIAKSVDH